MSDDRIDLEFLTDAIQFFFVIDSLYNIRSWMYLSRTCIYSVPGSEFRMFRSFARTDFATLFFPILQPHFKVLPHC